MNQPQILIGTSELLTWRSNIDAQGFDAPAVRAYAKAALDRGYSTLAYDIAAYGVQQWRDDQKLRYYEALALARARSFGLAGARVDALIQRLPDDAPLLAEVYGLKGRLNKDWLIESGTAEQRARLAWASMANYLKAYRISGEYYPAINAATMALVAGDRDSARTYADEVVALCESAIAKASDDDYWLFATLGEAFVILGDEPQARTWYERARDAVGDNAGDLASMRRQLDMLQRLCGVGGGPLETLGSPTVLAFVGHMLDQQDRERPRFPPTLESDVRSHIQAAIDRIQPVVGFCSAACGSDILFIESMLARNVPVHVLLPCIEHDFVEVSVGIAGPHWIDRYRTILDRVDSVDYATREGYLGDDVLFDYAAQIFAGKAVIKARELCGEARLLAVLEKGDPAVTGGTMETVTLWTRMGYASEIIDLQAIRGRASEMSSSPAAASRPAADRRRIRRSLKTMIFADIAGFSRLSEEHAPSFFVNFLGRMAAVIRNQPAPPAFKNTWGDGLYLVYDDVMSAAHVADGLRRAAAATDWTALGMSSDTGIRIGIHTGPVYDAEDPVLRQPNFFGSHVTRAARIEPIAAPGAVFVSEQTAAILEFLDQDEFRCEPLGEIPLAKGYDIAPVFRLRRIDDQPPGV